MPSLTGKASRLKQQNRSRSRESKKSREIHIRIVPRGSATVELDLLAVYQGADKKPILPSGDAYRLLFQRAETATVFSAKESATQFYRGAGVGAAQSLLLLGMGLPAELSQEKMRRSGAFTWAKLSAEKVKSVTLHFDSWFDIQGLRSDFSLIDGFGAWLEGFLLASYHFTQYKSDAVAVDQMTLDIVGFPAGSQKELLAAVQRAYAVFDAVSVARDWSNEPSNIGTPEYFALESKKWAKRVGLKCTVLSEAQARREKMGLFLGVGQGAEREGKIVILEHDARLKRRGAGPDTKKTVVFVGKGVTFDSGGISIKPSTRMEEMKHDMSGASTVMGAVLLAASLQSKNRVVAIMAFTENMPSGNAIQPGNVLVSRSGKTVEIINTDAEGRLVLADVLDYAHRYKPDAIIDAATLTGAVGVALGKHCSAIFGNDENLVSCIQQAAGEVGERLWQLPLFDEYFDDMKSETADMKNSCNDSYGGAIRGAIFLKQFIRKGTAWAHLDIATLAANVSHVPYFPRRGATGAFVRTLARFATEF